MSTEEEQDLTRKQRREQAREQRKALEEAEAAGAQRRKRLIQLGSVAAAVIVVIVVIVVATGSGSSGGIEKTKSGGSGTQTPKVVTEVTALLKGIPQNGNTLGSPKAPVTMQYFGDLECPICRDFTLGALPKLIEKYVKTGKLKLEYRNLETATREPETFRTQQVAALAAGKQQKAWDYIEFFYHQQGAEDTGYVTENYLQELAKQVPSLNLSDWTSARNDGTFINTITSDAQAANTAGFNGTPSFLIGKSGGTLQKFQYASLTDPSSFEAAIEKLL